MNSPASVPERRSRPLRILILSQVYHPDVAATAQYLTEFGAALAERGHQVQVLASRRAYDDPLVRFSDHEQHKGVDILRLPASGFGKGAKWRRALDFASFAFSTCVRLLFERKPDVVIALTTPPLISAVGAAFARWHDAKFCYWVMDLNPDEAVAAGWLRAGSFAERILQRLSHFSLKYARKIIVLDHFMHDRVCAKGVTDENIETIPPWSHDIDVRFCSKGREEFRAAHGLTGKFVVMYSGNHSPCHPLTTLMEAARALANDGQIKFCFIGGGSEFAKVKQFAAERGLKNMLCLPYQPLEKLSASLSAADLQVVVMGNEFVGMIHPCKIYNILKLGIPFSYIGPKQSHISEILDELGPNSGCQWTPHGQVDQLISHIKRAQQAAQPPDKNRFAGVAARFSHAVLLPRLIGVVEGAASVVGAGQNRGGN